MEKSYNMDMPTTPPSATPPYISPMGNGSLPPPPRLRYTTDRRDVMTACILLGFSLLTANFALFGGFHLGYVLGYVALLICGTVYLSQSRALRPTAYSFFCIIAALAGTGVFVWHNDSLSLFILYSGVVYLTMQALVDATQTGRRDSGTVASVGDVLFMLFARPMSHLGTALPALFRARREGKIEKRRCGGVLLGLVCALPVLAVLLPLLIGADAAFEGLMEHTILDNLGEVIATLAAGLLLFSVLFARLFSLRYQLHPTAAPSASSRRGIDHLALNAFLGVICGVYAVFILSQLAYFFSAFAGILPQDYTVAQYARRGFFEMCAISTINLLLTAIVLFLSRKTAGKAPRSTRLLCLFVLLFSIGMVSVALAKMWLYVGSFGMTRLRVLTSVFMLMLGFILLFVCVRLFAVRFPYMRAAVIAASLLGLATAYMDVDTVITRYNVRAYQTGALKQVDVVTLAQLSDGAVPYLLELCDDKDPEVARQATDACYRKLLEIAQINELGEVIPLEAMDFRSYNVDRNRARALLMDNAEKIRTQYSVSIHDQNTDDSFTTQEETYADDSAAHLEAYLGEYYHTQQVDYLGLVPIKGRNHTASVYHAYYPDSLTDVAITLGSTRIISPWLCKPNEIGIYIVADSEVYTLEGAYYSDMVYMDDVYRLLPTQMVAGDAL